MCKNIFWKIYHALLFAGAAVGPLLAGVVYKLGWNEVFYMLIFSDIMALIVSWKSIFDVWFNFK